MASRTAAGVPQALIDRALAKSGQAPARSAAAKGQHYKARTKAWLEGQGYAVAHLERLMWIRTGAAPCDACGAPRMFATKKDQLGADLLAVKADEPVTFVQVKLGASQLSAARREFAGHPFPPAARRWVVIWEPRARAPQVVDCSADTPASLGPVRRRKPADEGKLF